jgi:hypothetical protein
VSEKRKFSFFFSEGTGLLCKQNGSTQISHGDISNIKPFPFYPHIQISLSLECVIQ